nr:ATPase subunit 8 [Ecdeiocolea monostachya]
MPQLDKFTYLTQFVWLCVLFFTFYILFLNNSNGIVAISRILKLRKQLLSHRGNKIRSKDQMHFQDLSRKAFSTGVSYMYASFNEVSQWCKTVDYSGKRSQITFLSSFGEISGSRGIGCFILYLISQFEYKKTDSRHLQNQLMLIHVPHGQGSMVSFFI